MMINELECNKDIFDIVSEYSFVQLLDFSKAFVKFRPRKESESKESYCINMKRLHNSGNKIMQSIERNADLLTIKYDLSKSEKVKIVYEGFVPIIRQRQIDLKIEKYIFNVPRYRYMFMIRQWTKKYVKTPEPIVIPVKNKLKKKRKKEILLCPLEKRKIVHFKNGLDKSYYIAIPKDWFLLWGKPKSVCVEYKQDKFETAIFIRSDTELYQTNIVKIRTISTTAYVPLDVEFLFDNGISKRIGELPRLKLEYDHTSMILTIPPKLIEEGRKKIELLIENNI